MNDYLNKEQRRDAQIASAKNTIVKLQNQLDYLNDRMELARQKSILADNDVFASKEYADARRAVYSAEAALNEAIKNESAANILPEELDAVMSKISF